MFYYEQKRYSYCVPATRENFLQVIDNPFLGNQIRKIREVSAKMEDEKEGSAEYQKLHNRKSLLKQELPAWVFSAGHIAKSEKTLKGDTRPCRAEWRKSEYAKLNGLVMLDVDHVEKPEQKFAEIVKKWNETENGKSSREDAGGSPSWCGDFCRHYGILFVHVTPSGKGLRFVFKADPERGNLADNQAWLSRELGLSLDAACKDSVRLSYCCTREDIIYIELEELLTYNNEEFEKRFGEAYRYGESQPLNEINHPQPHVEINHPQPLLLCCKPNSWFVF